MTTTIEISFYPMLNDYPDVVLSFLEKLKALTNVEIQTNGMSTILIGSFDTLWNQLGVLIKHEFAFHASLFVMKVAAGRREQ
ncbi:MAG TPA: hypothetical protein VN763_05960 [Saprospiraceae bacterium]|nr:hypothetical protein [Saprospiraceae bacterium]HZV44620.1 hypothetical protein [Saprospiraceae bacterium]